MKTGGVLRLRALIRARFAQDDNVGDESGPDAGGGLSGDGRGPSTALRMIAGAIFHRRVFGVGFEKKFCMICVCAGERGRNCRLLGG